MGLFSQNKPRAPKSPLIKVSDFLSDKNVAFFPAGPSKRQVFGSLIGAMDLPDAGGALKAILAREEAGSTVIAPGLALPHARIPGISGIKAALGLCPSGIEYSNAVGVPVKLILLFLGPSDNMREHLAFLAGASSLLQMDSLPDALMNLTTPKDVIAKIRQAERKLLPA